MDKRNISKSKVTRKLYWLWYHAQFCDSALFPDNVEQWMKNSTANTLKQHVIMNHKAILSNSVRKVGANVIHHTRSIVHWFQPIQE